MIGPQVDKVQTQLVVGANSNPYPPIADSVFWMDSDYVYSNLGGTTLCTDGQAIVSFRNRSTNTVVAVSSAGTARPTYVAGPCFVGATGSAVRFNNATGQHTQFALPYNKRSMTLMFFGSNDPNESYLGSTLPYCCLFGLGDNDLNLYHQDAVGYWRGYVDGIPSTMYRMQYPYPFTYRLGPTSRRLKQYGYEISTTAATAGTGTTVNLTAGGATPTSFGGRWNRHVLIWDRVLTDDEVSQMAAWGMAQMGGRMSPATDKTIVMSGNSISSGVGVTKPYYSVQAILERYASAVGTQLFGTALAMLATASIASLYANQAAPYFTGRSGRKVAVIWEVVNDVQAGQTAAQCYTNYKAAATAARSAGADKVVAVGAPIQNWGGEPAMANANALIIADADGAFDVKVDVRQGVMATYSGTYFSDNYHPNNAGSQLLADMIWTGILSVLS